MHKNIEFEEINKNDPYLVLMTIDEFISACRSGCFIDYDGYGYYAFADKKSNVKVFPSEILKDRNEKYTHVVWINR